MPRPRTSSPTFRCPRCKGTLQQRSRVLHCPSCRRNYPLRQGIPLFTPVERFYEGKFTHAVKDLQGGYSPPMSWVFALYQRLNLTGSRQRFLASHLPTGSDARILDVGCGGGHQALASRPRVVGIDLSWTSLDQASRLYPHVCAASMDALPFEDETFDAVVALDVFGHIPPRRKDACLRELRRVLRPGGRLVMAVECDGDNPLMRFAKGFPALYRRRFIEEDGHVGLERASAVLRRLEAAGFEVRSVRGVEQNGRLPHWEFAKRFSGDYETEAPWIAPRVRRARMLTQHRLLGAASNLALGLWENLSRPFLPLDHANALLVEAVAISHDTHFTAETRKRRKTLLPAALPIEGVPILFRIGMMSPPAAAGGRGRHQGLSFKAGPRSSRF